MNKKLQFLFLILILINLNSNLFSAEENTKIIKRKVLILPFQNINDVSKYKFLATSLRDALNSELLKYNQYAILSFAEISNEIKKLGLEKNDAIIEINAHKISLNMKADVIIIGTYIIIEDRVKVQMKAIDSHEKQTIVSVNMEGNADLDIFRIIDDSVSEMANKMNEKLPPITNDYFVQQRRLLRQKYLTTKVKIGIGLTAAGGVLFLAGSSILIYDLAGFSSIVKDNLYGNPRTDIGYQEYLKTNYTHIALLSVGLSTFCTGICLMSIGIPLIIYDLRQVRKKLSFNIEVFNDLKFYIKLQI